MSVIMYTETPVRPSTKAEKMGTNGSQKEAESHSLQKTSNQEPLVPTLESLEKQIEYNRGRPLLMGRDLRMIRDEPGYRPPRQNWDRYCKARFRFGKRAADYYISAWATAQNCGIPDDFSPRSLRPLTTLTPEHQRQAWANALELKTGGRPAPKDIRIAASKFTNRPIAPWSLRAAHAVHQRHFKIGLNRALAGADEEQKKEYCDRLLEYTLDWNERHNAIAVRGEVKTAKDQTETNFQPYEPHLPDDGSDFDRVNAARQGERLIRQTQNSLNDLYEWFDLDPSLAIPSPFPELIQEVYDTATRLFQFMACEGVLKTKRHVGVKSGPRSHFAF